jgi:hypothetical protein
MSWNEVDVNYLNLEVKRRDQRIADLESENAGLKAASQQGHPSPCTLGPLCPYCEIDALRANLENGKTVIRALLEDCEDTDQTRIAIQQAIRYLEGK